VFSCYILHVIYVLLTETNRYYHQHLDRHDKTPNPLPDIMNTKMFLFLAIIVQMGNNICDRLMDYQTRTEQFFSPFYWKATTYVTEWRTIKQGQNNFSHLSIGRPQHMWQTEGLSNKDRTIFLTFLLEGHNICDRLTDYQTRTEQFFSPFYWKATTYVTDWGTIKQGQNNFSHLSTGIQWHETISCTSCYTKCFSETMTQNSTRMTTIMTDCGK